MILYFSVPEPCIWMIECSWAKAQQHLVVLWDALKLLLPCSTLESREGEEETGSPVPELPQKAACGPSWVTPSSAGGLLDICNSSRCALDATAQTVFSSQTAIAFSQAATLYLLEVPHYHWLGSSTHLTLQSSHHFGQDGHYFFFFFYRWETGVQRLQHDFAMGWVWQGRQSMDFRSSHLHPSPD